MNGPEQICPMCNLKGKHSRQCQLTAIVESGKSPEQLEKERQLRIQKYGLTNTRRTK